MSWLVYFGALQLRQPGFGDGFRPRRRQDGQDRQLLWDRSAQAAHVQRAQVTARIAEHVRRTILEGFQGDVQLRRK